MTLHSETGQLSLCKNRHIFPACLVLCSIVFVLYNTTSFEASQSGGDIILLDNGVSEVAFQVIGDAFEEFNFSSLLL